MRMGRSAAWECPTTRDPFIHQALFLERGYSKEWSKNQKILLPGTDNLVGADKTSKGIHNMPNGRNLGGWQERKAAQRGRECQCQGGAVIFNRCLVQASLKT